MFKKAPEKQSHKNTNRKMVNKMDNFDAIESAFTKVKKNASSSALSELGKAITAEFKKATTCSVVNASLPISRLVMSTSPDVSTLDKVLTYMTDGTSKIQTIVGIWQGANKWQLEINKPVLDLLTPKELTAITCHEMWHVIYSDRTIKRLQDSLSFAITSSKKTTQEMLTVPRFRNVLRIPGLISCQLVFNAKDVVADSKAHKKYLEREMDADAFSAKKGYREALTSAIMKLEAAIKKESKSNKALIDDAVNYSTGIIDDLTLRRNKLAQSKLDRIAGLIPGSVLTEAAEDIRYDWFTDRDESFLEGYLESATERVFEEFGILGHSRLAPIERNQIDYAYVKCDEIRTGNDKMMVLSYVNSKIELIDYYLGILDDPKLSKKYKVPHTASELNSMRARLETIREKALNTKIFTDQKNIVVYYPNGYEG